MYIKTVTTFPKIRCNSVENCMYLRDVVIIFCVHFSGVDVLQVVQHTSGIPHHSSPGSGCSRWVY